MTAIAWIAGFDQDDDLYVRRWLIAGAVVLAAHVAMAAIYFFWSPQALAPGSNSPPIFIDFAPEAAAPQSDADLAPGPESAEAEAVQPAEAQPKVEKQPVIELPPSPVPEPEVVVPPKQDVVEKKQEEETPKPPQPIKEETRKPQVKSAPRATSSPKVEKRAAKTVVPVAGNTAEARALPDYRAKIAAHLQRFKQYPAAARAAGQSGTAVVNFSIDRSGRVLSRSLARSSGSSTLDTEVVAMIARANPMPPFPAALTQSQMAFSVPIRYSVR